MTEARAAFERWRDAQTFYREAVLDTATFYEDGHGRVVVWHTELGVLKTLPLAHTEEGSMVKSHSSFAETCPPQTAANQ